MRGAVQSSFVRDLERVTHCTANQSPNQSISGSRIRDVIYPQNPLRDPQRHFVSNAVSNVKIFMDSMVNLGGQMMLQIGEIWTSENVGEQGIWA